MVDKNAAFCDCCQRNYTFIKAPNHSMIEALEVKCLYLVNSIYFFLPYSLSSAFSFSYLLVISIKMAMFDYIQIIIPRILQTRGKLCTGGEI